MVTGSRLGLRDSSDHGRRATRTGRTWATCAGPPGVAGPRCRPGHVKFVPLARVACSSRSSESMAPVAGPSRLSATETPSRLSESCPEALRPSRASESPTRLSDAAPEPAGAAPTPRPAVGPGPGSFLGWGMPWTRRLCQTQPEYRGGGLLIPGPGGAGAPPARARQGTARSNAPRPGPPGGSDRRRAVVEEGQRSGRGRNSPSPSHIGVGRARRLGQRTHSDCRAQWNTAASCCTSVFHPQCSQIIMMWKCLANGENFFTSGREGPPTRPVSAPAILAERRSRNPGQPGPGQQRAATRSVRTGRCCEPARAAAPSRRARASPRKSLGS